MTNTGPVCSPRPETARDEVRRSRGREFAHPGAAAHPDPDRLTEALSALAAYCRDHGWAGHDPYDALNSPLVSRTPLGRSSIARIAMIQTLKRLPVNLRPALAIGRERNPKAIALFLMAYLKLARLETGEADETGRMIELLEALRAPGTPYWCWGYSFPWQTRTNLVPRGAPNLVCTTFAANALLDVYEQKGDARCLEMASGAADYILNELYWTDAGRTGFSYPLPRLRTEVHNANFLGAALLCRTAALTGETKYLGPALSAARHSASRQRDDGSWSYGELSRQRWVDNFHTGFNLCALRTIARYAGTTEFDAGIRQGFAYYRRSFFREDGAPKYYHDRIYPIDIHSVAQSIITLAEFREYDAAAVELAAAVFRWARDHMRDRAGYFYYQVHPWYTNRISYMRWSQAWMLLAMAELLAARQQGTEAPAGVPSDGGRR